MRVCTTAEPFLLITIPAIVTLLWVAGLLVGGTLAYMAPLLIAVALGTGFIAYRAANRDEWALVTILVFLIVVLSISFRGFVPSDRSVGAVELDWQNGLKVVTWLALLMIGLANPITLRYLRDPALMLWACFCCICLISTSYAQRPTLSAISSLSQFAYLWFSLLLVGSVSERRICLVAVWALTGYAMINIASAALPDISFTLDTPARFQGLASHPNQLGRQMALLVVIVFTAYYRGYLRPATAVIMAVLASSIMLASGDRTALISIVVAFLLTRRKWPILLLSGALVAVTVVMLGYVNWILQLVGREGSANEAVSMAGRDDLWSFVLDMISRRPIFGYGFNNFEAVAEPIWNGPPDASVSTHNNYLEVMFTTGVLGAIPYATALSVSIYRWLFHPDQPRDMLVITLMIGGLTDVDIASIAVLPTLVFFIVLSLDAARRMRP